MIMIIIAITKTFIESLLGASYCAKCFVWISLVVITTLIIPADKWGNQSSERESNLFPFYRWELWWLAPAVFPGVEPSSPRPLLRHHDVFQHLQVTHGVWDHFGAVWGFPVPAPKRSVTVVNQLCLQATVCAQTQRYLITKGKGHDPSWKWLTGILCFWGKSLNLQLVTASSTGMLST